MRLCRYTKADETSVGLYYEDGIVSVEDARILFYSVSNSSQFRSSKPDATDGLFKDSFAHLDRWLMAEDEVRKRLLIRDVKLDVPIANPPKLLLLAGNYAEHIIERGGTVAERTETFPYIFMKPPSTTLIPTGAPIVIPSVAPLGVDWECELAVVIGKRVKNVSEENALAAVAGYTVINDISQRHFRPTPGRKKRERDVFFDWQHGKWFDSFCPCGPCIISADHVPDPQNLKLKLTVNGEVKQNGSTGQMIFPVAAVIAFISTFVTLEPGDIISTGTPKGVGGGSVQSLKPGDVVEASIDGIGMLRNPVVAE